MFRSIVIAALVSFAATYTAHAPVHTARAATAPVALLSPSPVVAADATPYVADGYRVDHVSVARGAVTRVARPATPKSRTLVCGAWEEMVMGPIGKRAQTCEWRVSR